MTISSLASLPYAPAGLLRRSLTWAALLLSVSCYTAPRAFAAVPESLQSQEQDLLSGRVDRAVSGLQAVLSRDPGNASAHLLLCRSFLSELHGSEAAGECQAALRSGLAQDSEAQDWAGRALGAQAEHAGPLAGLKLAGQVRTAFQTAYRLNPRNPAAANDLGEFYINAPSLVGGGVSKASSLADSVQSTLPQVAHRLRGLAAEKQGNLAGAEAEFVAETQAAPTPGTYVDLACFYVRRHQTEKGLAAVRRAVSLDHVADADIVDAASTLNDLSQTAQAMDLLHRYLEGSHQSDQAPAFRVHTLLGEMLSKTGDRTGARKEFEQALGLAANYAPARKGLAAL